MITRAQQKSPWARPADAPGVAGCETPTHEQTERNLAPLIAEAMKRDPRYRLSVAIADWQTTEGLDCLREHLVRRGLFDTEALRAITRRREQIGGKR